MHEKETLRIGELAARAGVSPPTIRYYEEAGVMPPANRTANGYRVYGQEDLDRLLFITRARALEFSLEEISEILALREQGKAPCAYVLAQIDARLAEIAARLTALEQLHTELRQLKEAAAALPLEDIERQSQICHILHHRHLIRLQDMI